MGDTRDYLKSATAAAHRTLDENRLVMGLQSGTISHAAYHRLLWGYLRLIAPWEKRILKEQPELVKALGVFRFEKSSWLADDLDKLGDAKASPAPLPSMAAPGDLPGLAGCLYVMEGSTLGGMHLSRSKNGFPSDAGRFFQGYGKETMPSWNAFIEWLERTVTDAPQRERAAQVANETFAAFQREFDAIAAQVEI